jgi:hypothetical protein
MEKAGKSVLWFLGGCMVFTQVVISIVSKSYSNIGGGWILFFGFMCLLVVLTALIIMFVRNPVFITAERGDLVPLTLIQHVARNSNPELLRQLVTSISSSAWLIGEVDAGEDEDTETEEAQLMEEEIDEKEEIEDADRNGFLEALDEIIK